MLATLSSGHRNLRVFTYLCASTRRLWTSSILCEYHLSIKSNPNTTVFIATNLVYVKKLSFLEIWCSRERYGRMISTDDYPTPGNRSTQLVIMRIYLVSYRRDQVFLQSSRTNHLRRSLGDQSPGEQRRTRQRMSLVDPLSKAS
jgi:hypothetical protein